MLIPAVVGGVIVALIGIAILHAVIESGVRAGVEKALRNHHEWLRSQEQDRTGSW